MQIVFVFLTIVAVATAFDCFGKNNSCADSHTTCDTGYDPFCEHTPGPFGRYVGICTCDKDCQSAADCSNAVADGCPSQAHPVCDMRSNVCHCFGPPQTHDNES